MKATAPVGPLFRTAERRFAIRCFTLIELLVVIVLIGILAALLLPVLNRAKEASRSLTCLSNMRQLGIAAMTYGMDNKGQLPVFWQWLHDLSREPGISAAQLDSNRTNITSGLLYPHLKSKGVYLCPTDRMALAKFQRRGVQVRDSSYAMNCQICHDADPARYVAPARTLLFMEASLDAYDFSGVVGPHPQRGVTNTGIWLRHNNRGHLVFCDSHVERVNAKGFSNLDLSYRFWYPVGSR